MAEGGEDFEAGVAGVEGEGDVGVAGEGQGHVREAVGLEWASVATVWIRSQRVARGQV